MRTDPCPTTPMRRWPAVSAAAALGILVTYALAVWTPAGQLVDTQVMLAAESTRAGWAELLLEAISPAAVVAALGLVTAVALALRGTAAATTAAATVVVTLVGSELLKTTLVRPAWIDDAGNSLPSGHVSAVAAIAVAAYLAVPVTARTTAAAVGLLATASTAAATMALGWHRPSDAIASMLLAIGVGAAIAGTRARVPASMTKRWRTSEARTRS